MLITMSNICESSKENRLDGRAALILGIATGFVFLFSFFAGILGLTSELIGVGLFFSIILLSVSLILFGPNRRR